MNSLRDFWNFLRSGWWLAGAIFYPIATCFITMILMGLQIVLTPDMIGLVFATAIVPCIILEILIYLILREE